MDLITPGSITFYGAFVLSLIYWNHVLPMYEAVSKRLTVHEIEFREADDGDINTSDSKTR
jgi:hypothetical protein